MQNTTSLCDAHKKLFCMQLQNVIILLDRDWQQHCISVNETVVTRVELCRCRTEGVKIMHITHTGLFSPPVLFKWVSKWGVRIDLYVMEKPLTTMGFIGGVFVRVKISLTTQHSSQEKVPILDDTGVSRKVNEARSFYLCF